MQNHSKILKCLVVGFQVKDSGLLEMSIDEQHRLSVIELIGSNTVGLVCVMCMPARALAPQPLRCVL